MLDLGHLAEKSRCDVQVFNRPSTVTNTQWLTWTRPRGTSMLFAYVEGGGAGGGGGLTAGAGTARGGGGGGGSSGSTRILVPSILLPETLFLQVGAGGVGVTTGTGASGVLSYIAIAPNTTASNVLAVSGAAAAVGGTTGTAAAAGTGGAAGTIAVIASMPLAGLGMYFMIAGQAGQAGGAHTGANGVATTIPVTGALTQGGSGGAGTTAADFNGGLVTAIAGSYLSNARPIGAAAGQYAGCGGPAFPFFSFAGLGAASDNTTGGAPCTGGNGAPGSGGGGGGGNPTGSSGKGGDGGAGQIVMISW